MKVVGVQISVLNFFKVICLPCRKSSCRFSNKCIDFTDKGGDYRWSPLLNFVIPLRQHSAFRWSQYTAMWRREKKRPLNRNDTLICNFRYYYMLIHAKLHVLNFRRNCLLVTYIRGYMVLGNILVFSFLHTFDSVIVFLSRTTPNWRWSWKRISVSVLLSFCEYTLRTWFPECLIMKLDWWFLTELHLHTSDWSTEILIRILFIFLILLLLQIVLLYRII